MYQKIIDITDGELLYAIFMEIHNGDYYETGSPGQTEATDWPIFYYNGKLLSDYDKEANEEKDGYDKEAGVEKDGYGPAHEARDKAYAECLEQCVAFQNAKFAEIQKFLAKNGIASEIVVPEDRALTSLYMQHSSYLIMFATPEQFAAISFESLGCGSEWNARFHWASMAERRGDIGNVFEDA